jgi:paired amphipathic helix protein Sin3a
MDAAPATRAGTPPAEHRPLNVSDALTYLDVIKAEVPPADSDQFLEIMKEFKTQA